jgi:hypothetical protein
MFEVTSRYFPLPQAVVTLPDGREVVFVRRRFLPRGETLPLLVEVVTVDGDRLDLIAARPLGNPEVFWHIADAQDTLDPGELTAEPGRRLRVPVPVPQVNL